MAFVNSYVCLPEGKLPKGSIPMANYVPLLSYSRPGMVTTLPGGAVPVTRYICIYIYHVYIALYIYILHYIYICIYMYIIHKIHM